MPEFELFDLGHVAALHRLLATYGLPVRRARCTATSSWACRAGCRARRTRWWPAVQALPAETTSWSATGIGRTSLAVAFAALAKGGHLRVGMEDTLTSARGVAGDAQRPARRACRGRLARLAQRPPMSTDEARELLQVKPR